MVKKLHKLHKLEESKESKESRKTKKLKSSAETTEPLHNYPQNTPMLNLLVELLQKNKNKYNK